MIVQPDSLAEVLDLEIAGHVDLGDSLPGEGMWQDHGRVGNVAGELEQV